MGTVTGGNAALAPAFKIQLVQWYLHRVYDELNGTLSDAIAPIPKPSRPRGATASTV
jgi:hypothetical protein